MFWSRNKKKYLFICLSFVCFVALRPKSTAIRATDKDLGQLVFTTRFFSQIVFSEFLIVLISFF